MLCSTDIKWTNINNFTANFFFLLPLEFSPLTENFLDVMKNGEMAVHADIHLQSSNMKQHNGVWIAPTRKHYTFTSEMFFLVLLRSVCDPLEALMTTSWWSVSDADQILTR